MDDESLEGFFLDTNYTLQSVQIRSTTMQFYSLKAAVTDFDLTGQVLWPAAVFLSEYLSDHPDLVQGKLCLEVGSGAGVLGLFVSSIARKVVLTDGQDVVMDLLRKNLQFAPGEAAACKVDWTDGDPVSTLSHEGLETQYPVVLGADVVHWPTLLRPLFCTVDRLLAPDGVFLLGYTLRSVNTFEEMQGVAMETGFQMREVYTSGSSYIFELRRMSRHQSTFSSPQTLITQPVSSYIEFEQVRLNRQREQDKEALYKASLCRTESLPTYSEFQSALDTESQLLQEITQSKGEFEERVLRHQATLDKINSDKAKLQRDLVRNVAENKSAPIDKGKRPEELRKIIEKPRGMSYEARKSILKERLKTRERLNGRYLDGKLNEIEARIAKNRETRDNRLREKAAKASLRGVNADKRSEAINTMNSVREVERIQRYISSQSLAQLRKSQYFSAQETKFAERRQLSLSKAEKIKQVRLSAAAAHREKVKFLEERLKASREVLDKKERDWAAEMELRLELQKLMDEDKRTKVERAQRRYNARREQLAERIRKSQEKVEKRKWEEEEIHRKRHEIAISTMIEKERFKETQELLSKSPKSLITEGHLKQLHVDIPKKSPAKAE